MTRPVNSYSPSRRERPWSPEHVARCTHRWMRTALAQLESCVHCHVEQEILPELEPEPEIPVLTVVPGEILEIADADDRIIARIIGEPAPASRPADTDLVIDEETGELMTREKQLARNLARVQAAADLDLDADDPFTIAELTSWRDRLADTHPYGEAD